MIHLNKLFLASVLGLALIPINGLHAQDELLPPQTQERASATPSLRAYTSEERLKDYLRRTFGGQAFLFSGMSAGIGQARNAPSEWGVGAGPVQSLAGLR